MTKPIHPLSEAEVRHAAARERPYRMYDGGGLYLEVTPSGGKYWKLIVKRDGKETRMSLGQFPTMGLDEARRRRDHSPDRPPAFEPGDDWRPSQVHVPSRAPADVRPSGRSATKRLFEAVARDWFAHSRTQWNDQTAREMLRLLERHVLPAVGAQPIDTLMPAQVAQLAATVRGQGLLETADRLPGYVARILRHASDLGLTEPGRAEAVLQATVPAPLISGELTEAELRDLVAAVRSNTARCAPVARLAMWLWLLTFARPTHLHETPWSEIDLEKKRWTMSPLRSGHAAGQVIALSRQALKALQLLHEHTGAGPLLFPNARDPGRPMADNTLWKVAARTGWKGRRSSTSLRAAAVDLLTHTLGFGGGRSRGRDTSEQADLFQRQPDVMQAWADYLEGLERV